MSVCLYRITCSVNSKCYIGITRQTPRRRFSAHLQRAFSPDPTAFALGAAIRKYGKETFSIEVVASVIGDKSLAERELIAQERTLSPLGYNLSAGGDGLYDPTPETRARMRSAHLGKTLPLEQRAKIAAAGRGRKMSPEAVEKSRAKQRGQKRASWGKHTDESRAKMSASIKLLRKPISEETRARMSAAHLGKTRSVESRAKQSMSAGAFYNTPEGKQILQRAHAARWNKEWHDAEDTNSIKNHGSQCR